MRLRLTQRMATTYGMGSEPILFICVCATIDAMLNFDGDFDVNARADVKCEQDLTPNKSLILLVTTRETVLLQLISIEEFLVRL